MANHKPSGSSYILFPLLVGVVGVLLVADDCHAVNIRVDYGQDSSGFFSSGTSLGQQARAALDAAAAFYSDILEDRLSPVSVPPTYVGKANPNGWATYYLECADPNDPFNSSAVTRFQSYDIAQDEYVIFVGGAAISGTQTATAGLGGSNYQYSLVAADVEEATQIYEDFENAIDTRGQTSGFAHWGGTISFDNDGSTTWNRDPNQDPASGQSDLYSVALHEMGHVLGFRRSTMESEGVINGNNKFIGGQATDAYGAPVPLQPGGAHWAEGLMSSVYGGVTAQETLYDPSFNGSVSKELTVLDAAALADLGWTVAPSYSMPGDFNGDHMVDAADYSYWRDGVGVDYTGVDYDLWRDHFGMLSAQAPVESAAAPEPACWTLLSVALALRVVGCWPRRRG